MRRVLLSIAVMVLLPASTSAGALTSNATDGGRATLAPFGWSLVYPEPGPALFEAGEPRVADVRAGCTVPALIGHTLAGARTLLARSHCLLGHVSWPGRRGGLLIVAVQSPGRGKQLPEGAAVAVRLRPGHGARE